MKAAKKVLRIESSEHDLSFKRILGFLIKLLIATSAFGYIAYKVNVRQADLGLFFGHLSHLTISEVGIEFVLPALALMLFNWSMEVVKWKYLLQTTVEISWRTSIKAILSGTTIGVFTPSRVGEFVGRVLALTPEKRIKGSFLSVVNGIAQSLATFSFGVLGLIWLIELFALDSLGFVAARILQLTLIISLMLVLLLFARINAMSSIPNKIEWLRKYQEYFDVFSQLDSKLLLFLYNLSLLRFLSFILQYIVVFGLLLNTPQWSAVLTGSIMTLFSSTIVPFIPVPDLLVREAMALNYFDLFHFDPLVVSVAIFVVWFINVAFPAILGSVLLFSYRIFKSK